MITLTCNFDTIAMCKTDYGGGGGGGGGKNVPKIDYVICERPLGLMYIDLFLHRQNLMDCSCCGSKLGTV